MFDRKAWNRAYRSSHRERIREMDRERGKVRRAAPGYKEYQASKILKCRYGISLEDKRKMYEEQKGLCLLCGKPLPSDFRKANVDHDHETDEVRGLLDWNCNKLIGFLEHNRERFDSAYSYLKWAKEK